MNQPLEIEIKYLVTDLARLREKILSRGWTSQGNHFEYNIRFEDESGSLYEKKQLLRLRKDTVNTLTFKAKSRQKSALYKIRRETEVTVNDFEAMRHIIHALGFGKEQIYEKWRETFHADGAVICLDRMPFGDFMEIEGPEQTIAAISEALGFSPEQGIKKNYLKLFSYIKDKEHLPFNDVTFDHFKTVSKDFTDHLRTFELGSHKLTKT